MHWSPLPLIRLSDMGLKLSDMRLRVCGEVTKSMTLCCNSQYLQGRRWVTILHAASLEHVRAMHGRLVHKCPHARAEECFLKQSGRHLSGHLGDILEALGGI